MRYLIPYFYKESGSRKLIMIVASTAGFREAGPLGQFNVSPYTKLSWNSSA